MLRRSARFILGRLGPVFVLLAFAASASTGQTTGTVLGRVVQAEGGAPVAGATVTLVGGSTRTLTGADGRFVLTGIPPGDAEIRVEYLGYRPVVLEQVAVRAGQSIEVRVELDTAPVEIPGVTVEARRVRLVEPDVSGTRDIVVAREIHALPVDRLDQVVELSPGVSAGHFRGGRTGQEAYVVDGIQLKNQLEATTQGLGLELSPTSLEEVEVATGGFGAQYGSALSGVVSYVTRRGRSDRWEGRASLLTDGLEPASLTHGFSALSVTADGPVPLLGKSGTIFADLLAQGMRDAEPHAAGSRCLGPADATPDLAAAMEALDADGGSALRCIGAGDRLPNQRGDKLIAFTRLDRPLGAHSSLTVTLLHNRLQRELYTPEFRYNTTAQLGQRSAGSLGTLAFDWNDHRQGDALHLSVRAAGMHLDRYLGALDMSMLNSQYRLANFSPGNYRFLGEETARAPIEDQLSSGVAIPGYTQPGGTDTPFGAAGAGIFFSQGAPPLANWSRSDMLASDVVAEYLKSSGAFIRAGGSLRLYRVESYERLLPYLPGSSPNYARFYPTTIGSFVESHIADDENLSFDLGVRVEGFRPGLEFRQNRADFLDPILTAGWRLSVMPRLGIAMVFPSSNGGTVVRLNYGYVAQPPDFRYFLDTTIGDSLRTSIRRQGNPQLSFEKGKSLELGLSRLLTPHVGASLTLFRKVLTNLVTSNLQLSDAGDPLFTTDDSGRVLGAELAVRAQWSRVTIRAGYTLQKATGVASGADTDMQITGVASLREYPLAFDQRHAIDVSVLAGQAGGEADAAWSLALTNSLRSGYPLNRFAAAGGAGVGISGTYLPWTAVTDLRFSRSLGGIISCHGCKWNILLDVRNALGLDNVIAYRGDSGRLAPSLETVRSIADKDAVPTNYPSGSSGYSATIDFDHSGIVDPSEYLNARFAAALNRLDPSLFFGEARQLRAGLEITF